MQTKKILFANIPFDGHFNPLTSMAMSLKQAGYDVRWYSGRVYEKKIKSLGIPCFPFKRAMEITSDNMDTLFPERKSIGNKLKKLNFDIINIFVNRSVEFYEDIREIRESFPFDLLIADSAFTALPLVKENLRVPVIAVGVFPLTETSRDLAPTGFGMLPPASGIDRVKNAALRWFARNVIFGKSNRVMNRILDAHGISSEGAGLFDLPIKKSNYLLQSGTPGFEYHRSDLSGNIRFVGPLLPFTAKRNDTAWYDHRLISFDKVILVTQGTVEKDVQKLIIPVLEAYKNSDRLVVVTTGGSGTDLLRSRYPYNNIIIEDFIPFGDVMPYADVFVTNGGYGGVLLGIQNDLPMVVAGVHEGKNEINARIGYFGLGVNLRTETPAAMQLKQGIEKILNDPSYKTHVTALNREFRKYPSAELTVRYVEELIGKSVHEPVAEPVVITY